MAPKGGGAKRKGAAAPSPATPLTLFKHGLAAIRGWTPLAAARADAEALGALGAAARQLQARMGLTQVDCRSPTAAGAPPEVDQVGNQQVDGDGNDSCCRQQQDGVLAAAAAAANGGFRGGGGQDGGPGTAAEEAAVAGPEADPLAGVWSELEALAAGMASYRPIVRHSLDLDLADWQDEPGYLLASCHLEIGKLLGRMFPRREVAEQCHLEAALTLFPDFVAAGVALGQALLARADQPHHLQQAEARLRAALAAAERLAGGGSGAVGSGADDDDMLLAANAACRREWEAGVAARRSLAMFLCQEARDEEAAPLLAALQFTHRLARQVLHYPLDSLPLRGHTAADSDDVAGAGAVDWRRYVRAVDGALPAELLGVLRRALSPGGRFWWEHGYGRVGYFSYMHELASPALSAVHQAATLLHRLVTARFPAAAAARYAEWWAHCRRHPLGHQLHFDSDDEGAGGVRNPLVSAVIYLTGGVGGPTLVTPQLLGGPLAPHGWLVHPRANRLAMFDSRVLHGVIPGRGPSPRPGEHRITLMIAFWKDIKCRPREDGLPGPSQPFPAPSPAAPRHTWVADLPPHPDGPDGWGPTDPRDAEPIAIERVWERLDGGPAQPGAVQYDACFQGF